MSDLTDSINWPDRLLTLVESMSPAIFEPGVIRYLKEAGAVRGMVACSGGADSVGLLCLLVAQAKDYGLTLHVGHYNHQWRGEASEADAAFVASLAEALGLPFSGGECASGKAALTETTARTLRLEFLRQATAENACDCLFFGHQLDDIIETQLQRMVRGCGSEGLAAPRPVTRFKHYPTHLRPLLHKRGGAIRAALRAASIPWREDLSNEDTRIARNALRQRIVPDLSASLGRDAATGAAKSRQLLEEDAVALNTLAREQLPEAFEHKSGLDRTRLQTVPRALLRRALIEWLSGHGLINSLRRASIDILITTIRSRRNRFRMSAGRDLILLDSDRLTFERGEDSSYEPALSPVCLKPQEPVLLYQGARIQVEPVTLDGFFLEQIRAGNIHPEVEAVVADQDEGTFRVRYWQAGDRFFPLGAPGRRKLKDWFIDRGIPKLERKWLPVVISRCNEIVWVPGFPPAESHKIQSSTKKALRLTYRRSQTI